MTSWIEKAQEELAEVAKGTSPDLQRAELAQPRIEASRMTYDALSAVERLDTGLDRSRFDAQAAQDEAFRNLESRIREIAGRLDTPKAGSRPKAGARPLEEAIAEIRARQAALDAPLPSASVQDAPSREPPPAEPRIPAPREAQPIPSAPTVSRMPEPLPAPLPEPHARPPARDYAETPAVPPGLEGLRRDIDRVYGSIATLATRSDLGAIERSVGALASELATTRAQAGNFAPVEAEVEALQAEVRRLAGAGTSPTEGIAKLSRDIDIVSHKLDIVAGSGIDPSAIDGLSREIADVKRMLGGMAMPADISAVSDQLTDLKLELARVGSRQVDTQDFTSLRLAFEEMRDALSTGAIATGDSSSLSIAAVQSATKDELQPIASMLVLLIEKIERLERYSGDPEMMEQIERQIAGLSATIGSTASRDPALSDLSQAMADLMSEVSSWRSGAIEIAEQAARSAVAQTIEAMRGSFAHPIGTPAAMDPAGAEPDLASRHIEPPARAEVTHVEAPVSRDAVIRDTRSDSAGTPPREVSDAALRRLNEALVLGPTLSEADRPLPRAPEDEVLLEPGASRPRVRPDAPPEPESEADHRDVKASFIAAARRAAQAAAADADKTKGRAADRPAPTADTRQGNPSLRGMFDRLRRPLLVSAAALVFAIGGYRLLDELTNQQQPAQLAQVRPGPQGAARTAPPLVTAPPMTVAALSLPNELSDPTTTQSVAAREPQPALPAAQPLPAPSAETNGEARATNHPSSAQSPAPAPVGLDVAGTKQTSQLPASIPSPAPRPAAGADAQATVSASLKQAALNGDPIALYDMAVRTLEGRGVPRDPRAAVTLFEKAGEKNLAPAQYRAGNAYEKGIGVARDVEAARKWYQRAADNGNTRAMHNLAVLMAEGAGGRPDYASALTWFLKAAEHGVRDSQFNLAVLYARGLGTQQDMARSYTWFAVAAGQGDDEAARKRDEVAARLQPADLARAKQIVERWRVTPSNPTANEVQAPTSSSSSEMDVKRPGRA